MISINKKGLFAILAVLVSLDTSAASFFDKPAPKPETPAAETAVLPPKEATKPTPPPPPEIIPAKAPEAEAVVNPAPQVVAKPKPAPAPKTRRKQREDDDALEHIDTREEITEMLMRRVRR